MKKIIIPLCILSSIYLYASCSDGIYGDCTSLSDEYCSGVYSCSDLNGDEYIKVGSTRYNCAKSLVWEDTYDCSGGLAEAKKYCAEEPVSQEQCYRTDFSGKTVCYGSMLSKDQCNACGWSYSAVSCDVYANSVTTSQNHCN
jgi:hypothetical protein